jgi:hypothetical protein
MTTPDIAGLCERLRAVESSRVHGGFSADRATTNWYRNPDGPEAADTIERQAAEIERLREALKEADRLLVAFTGEGTATLGLSGKTQTDARTRGDECTS